MRYLNDEEINKVSKAGRAHFFYAKLISSAIKQDSILISEIEKELVN